MPKKYASAKDVKIAEVIRAFPLQALGGQAPKMNPQRGIGTYSNLHFRFESCVVNAKTGRKFQVWKDIVTKQDTLADLESIPVPLNSKGNISLKVLRLPTDAKIKTKLPLTSGLLK